MANGLRPSPLISTPFWANRYVPCSVALEHFAPASFSSLANPVPTARTPTRPTTPNTTNRAAKYLFMRSLYLLALSGPTYRLQHTPVRGVGVSLKCSIFVLNVIKWASENSVMAKFAEIVKGEVRILGILRSCGSPSNTSHLTSLCNTAGLITPSRSTGGVQPMETHPAVRPFRVDVPEEDLDDLRRHIAATRWPSKELVEDRSQGVQLATLRELARYWTTEYDWRTCEARLNALPQFTTEIDGVDIHFIHVRSRHDNALPLIMTHGWPGSVIELLETVGPLTDPTSHGGRAEDAFDLVLPSLPGYGFSGEPTELGWGVGRVGQAWAELMRRLGYTRYVAQGGDVGAGVTDAMGRQAPEGLVGIHTNLLVTALGGPQPADTEEERAAAAAIATFRTTGIGYFTEMATRPQTIGYALLDSPVALAAWLLDHDTDAYYKIARAFVDGQPSGNLTRDHVLDNITLYWLTGTGASAARSYWEAYGPDAPAAGATVPPPPRIPVAFTSFPGELWRTPRSWAEKSYPTLTYFNEVEKGGHFAAWEQPQLFSEEVRAAFRSLR